MLPLPQFHHHSPQSLDEAVSLLADLGDKARLIAGGTDLVPNMKHGLVEPEHLVSLQRIDELRGICLEGDVLHVGAMTTLEEVAAHPTVQTHAAAFAEAAGLVGGPHHRRMGTVGGNVCLDTRCLYFNQTYFWREALGFCLKKDGTACHVVTSGQNCVAAASNDTAPALMVLGGTIVLQGPKGRRELSADDFYVADGIYNTVKDQDEIVVGVRVPVTGGRRSAYEKLRRRGSIDFPLLSVAARVDVEEGEVKGADLVVSALAARPKRVKAARKLSGPLAELDVGKLAQTARKQCHPLSNIDMDMEWRKDMVAVLAQRAFERMGWADPG